MFEAAVFGPLKAQAASTNQSAPRGNSRQTRIQNTTGPSVLASVESLRVLAAFDVRNRRLVLIHTNRIITRLTSLGLLIAIITLIMATMDLQFGVPFRWMLDRSFNPVLADELERLFNFSSDDLGSCGSSPDSATSVGWDCPPQFPTHEQDELLADFK